MKNLKMKTKITLQIAGVIIVCITLLYVAASQSMTSMMKRSELQNMDASLHAQTNIIKQYIESQEALLTVFSKAPEVRDILKNPTDPEKQKDVQAYTKDYYSVLDRWEGLYIGEWDTHIIAHSNPSVVGITTRQGEELKSLQDAISQSNGLYNAGIIVSPASEKLILSMYCPVFDEDGKSILGYVGGGPFADGLQEFLDASHMGNDASMKYSMINVENGTYIFDAEEANVAKEIKDTMLLSVIDKLKGQNEGITGGLEYEDEKMGKSIARYQYIGEHGFAVVAYDSESNIYINVRKNMMTLGTICIFSVLIISMVSWIFISTSTKPLKYVKESIMNLENLNLKKNNQLALYLNHKSEIGQISTALDSLYTTFQNIVLTLDGCSVSLNQSSVKMTESSEILLECMHEQAAATTQFASHTEEITYAVQHVDEEMENITEVVSKVESKIHQGTKKSDNLLEKVSDLQSEAKESIENVSLQIEENQRAINKALGSLQSLMNIDEMAEQILEITRQTNLLALNASIEAARAGESGRGFAVVADEIGSLAGSSSKTAVEIQAICNETKLNISKVEKCFDDIIAFLQEDVATQFASFSNATKDNYQSIMEIQSIIGDIDTSSNIFSKVILDIKNRIDEVQSVPEDGTVDSGEMLKRVEQTKKTSKELDEIVGQNKENALAIQKIVERFTGYREGELTFHNQKV
ncbi:MAG: methyl-accepting chemotaxis protein [Lachnospiraceae bacterium]|nr:methyl-accepting chemotaxis protein [Lachnospiraceae bacterium]